MSLEQNTDAGSLSPLRLHNIFLHVTKACNLRCAYCYFSASKPLPNEMSAAEFKVLWPDIVAIAPRKVVFTGGEPLVRQDILSLLSDLRDADPENQVLRCLNSNGHFVTMELARQLVGLANEVRVSLDGLRDRNDALRGTGNFAAAVQALETYYAVGFEPKVLVTVTSLNLSDLEELLCFLIRRKITRINLNAFRPIGRGSSHPDWRANIAGIHEAVQRAWQRCHVDDPLPESPEADCQSHCGVGRFLNIMPNGDVFPCHVLTDPEFRCGNVRNESLVHICRRNGLLGTLAGLDFRQLARQDAHVAALTRPSTCMGTVYAQTKSLSVWGDILPLVQPPPKGLNIADNL